MWHLGKTPPSVGRPVLGEDKEETKVWAAWHRPPHQTLPLRPTSASSAGLQPGTRGHEPVAVVEGGPSEFRWTENSVHVGFQSQARKENVKYVFNRLFN